ncbi:tetratricopeptide repeat-containing diguanylate cyclase [Thalassotalea atypica]|uniref:tetratricopeptide repeat-containing diguanylate cyclase n=1 Tax=Thalassotalea atypica TaxID=2054316 RepID=UPI0025736CDF|nr:tetratricopeptide repeat-containing diguanylate cyclase [Thalassotalea atypica]
MISILKVLVISLSLLCSVVSAKEAAISIEHFKSIENDINRDPYPVYLQLIEIEKHKRALLDEDAFLWLLYRKAQAENLLYLFDDFEQTVAYASTLITEFTDVEIVSALAVYQGVVSQRKGSYKESLAHLERSMRLSRQASLNYLYVWGKQEAAYTSTLQERYEASLADMQEAYVEAYALNDHFLIAVINEVYGAIYGYMDDYEKSIDYYQKALDTYERLGYQPYIAEAIYGLATTYRYWKKYDLAIQKFTQYRDKIAYTPNQDISFFGEYGLGMTYAEQGDCESAIPVIDYALTLHGQEDYNAELLKRKAECLISQDKLVEAQEALDKATAIFDTIPELDGTTWQLALVKLEGMLLYAQGDKEAGYEQLKNFYEQYTDLLIKNSSQKIIKIRETMDLERLDIEITALKDRERFQLLQVKQKEQETRQQYFLILFALFVIALILVIVFIQYRNNKKVFALSITDSLTGVFNRRYIFDYLEKILKNTSGTRGELSVLLFDIDDFKQVNDQYGHPFGDDVLRRTVEITQATLRTGDIVGRIGGEEFFCILPRTDSELALQVAERLKENIQNEFYCTDKNEQVAITVSIGITALGEAASDRASLYIQSDKALYQAKQQGKNRVVIYTPSP